MVDSFIGRTGILRSDSQYRVECRCRPKPTIEAEDKLVEVSLEVFGADPMMCAEQPGIKVAEDNVNHREVCVRDCVVATNCNTVVGVPRRLERIVSIPAVSTHDRPGLHGRQNKRYQRFLRSVRDDLEPEPPCDDAPAMASFGGFRFCLPSDALSRSALRPRHFFARMSSDQVRILARERNVLPWTNLDGANDQRLVVDPLPLTLCRTTNQSLVHLDGVLTADQVSVGAHHRSTQLVEHLEGSLITRHAQPLLKLEGAQSGGTMRHKICAPKPGGYGNLAAVDESVRGHAYVTPTGSAPDNLGSIAKAQGLASDTATRAVEAVGKAMRIQIVEAGSLVGEEALEVREGLRRRQVGWDNGWVSGMATFGIRTGYAG